MLTPEQLKEIPDYFVGLYQDLEQFIIKDFARRVGKAGSITETAEWQAIRAAEMGMALSDLEKEIKRVSELAQSELDNLMIDVANASLKNDAKLYEAAGELAPSLAKSDQLQNYVQAAIDQTKGELFNMTQSLGFARKINGKIQYLLMSEYYHNVLDMAHFQVSTGVTDYLTATRNAVKKMCQSGLRWIDYESGWANRVDVAARRAILTGVNQMSGKFNDQVISDLNAEYAETTAHSGARPSHADWQGRVFKIKGAEPGYPNLYTSTGLGTGPGLCGWNCRHNYYAFFPGISTPAYTAKELKALDNPDFEYNGKNYTHYEATQKQRQIETAMRQTKNELIGYDTLGDKEAFTTASIKIQRQREFYKEFSNAAGLPYQNDRHQVLGFDKSISQKSVWVNKKAQSYNNLIGVKTANGIEIKGVSKHFAERCVQRDIEVSEVENALTDPLHIGTIKEKANGKSQEFIGDKARVHVNPDNGNAITAWKTSAKLREKYAKR
ncbi:phage minor capsid protein [Eubacteriaceae bacterium ES2]|nr:phage minor capsid protein [Eubacteriaceae bacterium ES2]